MLALGKAMELPGKPSAGIEKGTPQQARHQKGGITWEAGRRDGKTGQSPMQMPLLDLAQDNLAADHSGRMFSKSSRSRCLPEACLLVTRS